MQKYQSHKIVEAGKVLSVEVPEVGDEVTFRLEGVEHPVRTTRGVYNRIQRMASESKQAGLVDGYLIRYPDNYVSWSPAEAFEDGYDPVQPSTGKSAIKGYRELTATEIANMNAVKEHGASVGRLVDAMAADDTLDQSWVSIARTQLQQGFMALTRAIAKPEFF